MIERRAFLTGALALAAAPALAKVEAIVPAVEPLYLALHSSPEPPTLTVSCFFGPINIGDVISWGDGTGDSHSATVVEQIDGDAGGSGAYWLERTGCEVDPVRIIFR